MYVGKYETHTEQSATGNEVIVVDVDERMLATFAKDAEGNVIANPTLSAAISSTSIGTLAIRTNQSQNADIEVTPYDSNAKILYGVAASSSATPSMGSGKRFNLADQNFLYLQVIAENTENEAFYKFRVEVGRIATIKTLTLLGGVNDSSAEYEIANIGTQRADWAIVANGKFQTADMPNAGFSVKVELNDPASTATYELIGSKGAPEPGAFTNPGKVIFDGAKVLAVKVVSENTKATRFYKIEVELLAASFKKQPKPNYYYYIDLDRTVGQDPAINWYDYAKVDKPSGSEPNLTGDHGGQSSVVPLEVEMDRAVTGTYQWYEANSWYGGYGFDADGRILFYPSGNPTAVQETGFTQTAYHRANFDEKKNVSLHNGGNEFYRLPTIGRPISGASGTLDNTAIVPPYTPQIDKRPFMVPNGTNETHYYWVVVKDAQGREAVSKRAPIISEWDPSKAHYIVDLNEELYEGTKGGADYVQGYARNQKVFKIKRETYVIPITLPPAFNMNDYTIATVQALFFLKDGTPWIQNWTQGDIGFEDESGDRVMYYNLTNNNGTLGLVGGGKEPSGGTVKDKPKYLIVKPAGEKPVTELPPFEADGVTPRPNNDAQGWFCGYIELVEVSFEGPGRE
jgi:hypothetical protein